VIAEALAVESPLQHHGWAGTLLSRIPEKEEAGMSPVADCRRGSFFLNFRADRLNYGSPAKLDKVSRML
jgi:hypothetical protein